jgi:thiamine biosynthesis protein ThiI
MGLILLRYGEIALKGRNRHQFLSRLRRNIRICLRQHEIGGELQPVGQRLYLRTDQVEEALQPLSRLFGLVSLSPVREARRDLDAIIEAAIAEARLAGLDARLSYRVVARRADKTFPHISPEINRLVGEGIAGALGGRIDLSRNADLTIGVEVAQDSALVFGRSIAAPGGFPVGVEGRVVALLSGGIDSPVAAWLMMKRGCSVIPVHFAQSETERAKALDNVAQLARYSYGWQLRPEFLDHYAVVEPVLERLRELGETRWSCVFCKRALIAQACQIAEERGALAIVMGDSLGQVASQSLTNLAAISYGAPMPILRPLIGMDKAEIVALARRIGTFDISTRAQQGCAFLPHNPVTRGSLDKLRLILSQLEPLEAEPHDTPTSLV